MNPKNQTWKKSTEIKNSEKENERQRMRDQRLRALAQRGDEDEDVALQKALAQIYAMENPLSAKNNTKSDEDLNANPSKKPSKPISSPKPNQPANPLTPVTAPSKEELEKARQKDIADAGDIIRDGLKYIDQFAQRPLSLQKYLNVLMQIANAANVLTKLDPEALSTLEKLGIKDEALELLKDPNSKHFVSTLHGALYSARYDM